MKASFPESLGRRDVLAREPRDEVRERTRERRRFEGALREGFVVGEDFRIEEGEAPAVGN